MVANLDPEKRVEVSADIILAAEKKNIIHGALFLQDNLVKSDYGLSKDNFNYFVVSFYHNLMTKLKIDIDQLPFRYLAINSPTSIRFIQVTGTDI